MAGLQAPTAEEGFELTALSKGRESTPGEPFEPSQSPSIIDVAQSRSSLSDVYDIENADVCTAAIRTIPRESCSDRIQLRVRDIRSNKIARRTLQAMIVTGALTALYQFVCLFPAFQSGLAASRSLEVQIQVQNDSRQSLVYMFLKECENRKSQNLPLGPDCEKYLAAYPKAPPGIEKWVTPQVAYAHPFPALTTRAIKYDINQTAAVGLTLMVDQRYLRALFASECFALGSWSAVRLMPARQKVLVWISTGVILIPIFVWAVVPVSKFAKSGSAAGLVCSFAMASSLTRRLGFDKAFIVTATYATVLVVLLETFVPHGIY